MLNLWVAERRGNQKKLIEISVPEKIKTATQRLRITDSVQSKLIESDCMNYQFFNYRYWPDIDTALRTAAIDNKVSVKLLISYWNHSRPSEDYFLKSLMALSESYKGVDIQVVSLPGTSFGCSNP